MSDIAFFEGEREDVKVDGWGDGEKLKGGVEGGEKHDQDTLYEKKSIKKINRNSQPTLGT